MTIQSVGARVQRIFLLPIFALLASPWACAQEVGTVTLLKDSPLHLIRGVSVMQGVEGMRLRQGDILETGPAGTGQAQLEFGGGAVVEMGPSSQVYIFNQNGATAELVLLSGWLKGETSAGIYRYSSPLITATSKGGSVLLHASADSVDVFVEHGAVSVSGGAPAPIQSSADKIFFTRKAGKPVAAAERPSGAFIGAMPLCFRDMLPSRLAAFEGKKPPMPRIDHDVSYPEVEHWLMLPPAWRKGFASRFRPRLQDSAFHKAIEDHLAALPDWAPTLHPENLKTGPAAADKPSSPPGD